jgi:DNA-binding NarL/FixJ family response regulator
MKILLIDHHELFREGLCHLLKKMPTTVERIFEAGNFLDGLKLAENHPDLILLELNAPECDSANSVKTLRQNFPRIPIVVVSSEENSNVIAEALRFGASGYFCKSSPGSLLLSALDLVLAGSIYVPMQFLQPAKISNEHLWMKNGSYKSSRNSFGLTHRQSQVLALLSKGFNNKEIALEMQIAEGTAKVHVASLYQALRVNNRTEAVRIANCMNLFESVA